LQEPSESAASPKKNRTIIWVAAAIVLVLILVAVVAAYVLNPPLPQTANIQILEAQSGTCPSNVTTACRFSPQTSTIPFGGSVIWFNNGNLNHTITWATLPNGSPAGLADSGPLAPKAAYIISHVGNGGTFGYHCSIHPWMTGSLTVK
jgi:plastocyanin